MRLGPSQLDQTQRASIRDHLSDIVRSDAFKGGKRAQEFLERVVQHALDGDLEGLKERSLGAEMFGRNIDYDTANDAVVRVKAIEVRRRLADFYRQAAGHPQIRIEIPLGTYVPEFHWLKVEVPSQKPKRSAPGWALWSGLSVASIAILVSFFVWRGWKTRPIQPETHTICVLPLVDMNPTAGKDNIADSMTEELIVDLGQISALRVISRTSSMAYKGTQKTLPAIARELNADTIVEGSVLQDGPQIRITAELIDARDDRYMWTHSYTRDVTGVLTLEGEVAQAIADGISVNLQPQERARLQRVIEVNPEARDLYLRALQSLDDGNPQNAITLLESSIRMDPNYAQAHARLADAYLWMGNAGWMSYRDAYPKVKFEALRAIELDPFLAEAHATLSAAAADYDWDWETQRVELEKALQLNPNSAQVHWAYADYLVRHQKYDEAIAEGQRALELDPVSSRAYMTSAFLYYFAHRYETSMAQMQRSLDFPHSHEEIFFPLGDIDAETGHFDKAIENFKQLGDAPHALGHLGNAYARTGHRSEADHIIVELEDHLRKSGVGAYEIALVYAGLNEKDRAFEWLNKCISLHDKGLGYLLVDPLLAPLKDDPRYLQLARKVGIVH